MRRATGMPHLIYVSWKADLTTLFSAFSPLIFANIYSIPSPLLGAMVFKSLKNIFLQTNKKATKTNGIKLSFALKKGAKNCSAACFLLVLCLVFFARWQNAPLTPFLTYGAKTWPPPTSQYIKMSFELINSAEMSLQAAISWLFGEREGDFVPCPPPQGKAEEATQEFLSTPSAQPHCPQVFFFSFCQIPQVVLIPPAVCSVFSVWPLAIPKIDVYDLSSAYRAWESKVHPKRVLAIAEMPVRD